MNISTFVLSRFNSQTILFPFLTWNEHVKYFVSLYQQCNCFTKCMPGQFIKSLKLFNARSRIKINSCFHTVVCWWSRTRDLEAWWEKKDTAKTFCTLRLSVDHRAASLFCFCLKTWNIRMFTWPETDGCPHILPRLNTCSPSTNHQGVWPTICDLRLPPRCMNFMRRS